MIVWIIGIILREYIWQIVMAIVTVIVSLVLVLAWSLAVMANPNGGGIYWLAAQSGYQMPAPAIPAPGGPITLPPGGIDLNPPPEPVAGIVSDAERYQLALAVWGDVQEAIVMTAISIAEDGSGNPAAMSGRNQNGTYDFGLWQINSSWWPQFGGKDALAIPINNARAAFVIWQRQGYCAWSTYGSPSVCYGIAGHNNAYARYLVCATLLSEGQPCKR